MKTFWKIVSADENRMTKIKKFKANEAFGNLKTFIRFISHFRNLILIVNS